MKKNIVAKKIAIFAMAIGTLKGNLTSLLVKTHIGNPSSIDMKDIVVFNNIIAAPAQDMADIKAQIRAAEAAYDYFQLKADVKKIEKYAEEIITKYYDLYTYVTAEKNAELTKKIGGILLKALTSEYYTDLNDNLRVNFILNENFKKSHHYIKNEVLEEISRAAHASRASSSSVAPSAPATTRSVGVVPARYAVQAPSGRQVILPQQPSAPPSYRTDDPTIMTLSPRSGSFDSVSEDPTIMSLNDRRLEAPYSDDPTIMTLRGDYDVDGAQASSSTAPSSGNRMSRMFKRK